MAADGLIMTSSHKTVNLQYHGVHVTLITAHHFASYFDTLPVIITASAFYKGGGCVPKLYFHRFSSRELACHPVFMFLFAENVILQFSYLFL